jgi:hypothetical protein
MFSHSNFLGIVFFFFDLRISYDWSRYRSRSEKFHSRSVADRVSGYEYAIRKWKGGEYFWIAISNPRKFDIPCF